MKKTQIPKIFWYSISLAIQTLSIGLIIIVWHSESVSVGMSDVRIVMRQLQETDVAIENTKGIVEITKQLEKQSLAINNVKKELVAKLNTLNMANSSEAQLKQFQNIKQKVEVIDIPKEYLDQIRKELEKELKVQEERKEKLEKKWKWFWEKEEGVVKSTWKTAQLGTEELKVWQIGKGKTQFRS